MVSQSDFSTTDWWFKLFLFVKRTRNEDDYPEEDEQDEDDNDNEEDDNEDGIFTTECSN